MLEFRNLIREIKRGRSRKTYKELSESLGHTVKTVAQVTGWWGESLVSLDKYKAMSDYWTFTEHCPAKLYDGQFVIITCAYRGD